MPDANKNKCPACGAALNAPIQGGRIKCSFCGTLVTVEAQDKKRGDEIICPECGAANPKDAQHCGRCGIKLEFNCPKCGVLNTYGTVFCVKCGVDIQAEIRRQQEEIQRQQEAELKQQNELRLQAERAKKKKRVSRLAGVGITLIVLLCIAAVMGISLYTTRYSPTARATRTADAAEKTATAEYLTLFHDDFSDANSGWGSLDSENGTANYTDNGYRINITAPDWLIWTTLPDVFQNDVQIEVDASRIDGAGSDYYGILCRYQDKDNHYFLAMSSNGNAAIEKVKQGDITFISSEDGKSTDVSAINHGNATNHLRADCVGDTLTLFINGEEALSAVDGEFTSGGIGIMVGTVSDGQSDILFKNFYVFRP